MGELTQSPLWRVLEEHAGELRRVAMRDLFAGDPHRFDRFSLRFEDFLVDYSKNRITEETVGLLLALARARGVEEWRDRMFAGGRINVTENRAVLHIALRNR